MGDGRWHLHALAADPGETLDLQAQQPALFKAMQADYAAWATAHGVLPMPAGYNPVRQVMINTVLNYWWPAYLRPALWGTVALALAGLAWAWRRRARHKDAWCLPRPSSSPVPAVASAATPPWPWPRAATR